MASADQDQVQAWVQIADQWTGKSKQNFDNGKGLRRPVFEHWLMKILLIVIIAIYLHIHRPILA